MCELPLAEKATQQGFLPSGLLFMYLEIDPLCPLNKCLPRSPLHGAAVGHDRVLAFLDFPRMAVPAQQPRPQNSTCQLQTARSRLYQRTSSRDWVSLFPNMFRALLGHRLILHSLGYVLLLFRKIGFLVAFSISGTLY